MILRLSSYQMDLNQKYLKLMKNQKRISLRTFLIKIYHVFYF